MSHNKLYSVPPALPGRQEMAHMRAEILRNRARIEGLEQQVREGFNSRPDALQIERRLAEYHGAIKAHVDASFGQIEQQLVHRDRAINARIDAGFDQLGARIDIVDSRAMALHEWCDGLRGFISNQAGLSHALVAQTKRLDGQVKELAFEASREIAKTASMRGELAQVRTMRLKIDAVIRQIETLQSSARAIPKLSGKLSELRCVVDGIVRELSEQSETAREAQETEIVDTRALERMSSDRMSGQAGVKTLFLPVVPPAKPRANAGLWARVVECFSTSRLAIVSTCSALLLLGMVCVFAYSYFSFEKSVRETHPLQGIAAPLAKCEILDMESDRTLVKCHGSIYWAHQEVDSSGEVWATDLVAFR